MRLAETIDILNSLYVTKTEFVWPNTHDGTYYSAGTLDYEFSYRKIFGTIFAMHLINDLVHIAC